MNSTNTRSSGELKKEVLRELNKVEGDIDRIQGRLTPGQFIDDAIFYSHNSSPKATFDHLKNNPVGTSFLALGTLLLMEDQGHHSYEDNLKESAKDAIKYSKNKASHLKESMKGQIDEKIAGAKGSFHHAKEMMDAKVSETKESIIESQEKVQNLPPLSFVALGLGLGALSGAALPVSDKEKHFVDEQFGKRMADFSNDLKMAIDQSTNILKNEFIKKVKDVDVGIFNRREDNLGEASESAI